jgi:hypothetical protein
MEEEKWHGTKNGYDHKGCRCDRCRSARKAHEDAARARRYATPKDPDDPRHGTQAFYANHGCRCDACSAEARAVYAKYRGPLKRLPREERFWSKVNKTETCWLWTDRTDDWGYGHFSDGGTTEPAHRASYKMANGPIPDGLFIDHMCHTPACIRPEHLRFATNKQNQDNLSGLISTNTSGVRGVQWDKRSKKWTASVGHHGKRLHVGTFADIKDAEAAVIAKRNELFTHNILDRKAA